MAAVPKTAERRALRVQLPLLPLGTNEIGPRGAVWSARHPVTVEIMGSNPIGDALLARYANRQSGQAQTLVTDCGFDSHPCYSNMRRLGIGEPKWL